MDRFHVDPEAPDPTDPVDEDIFPEERKTDPEERKKADRPRRIEQEKTGAPE